MAQSESTWEPAPLIDNTQDGERSRLLEHEEHGETTTPTSGLKPYTGSRTKLVMAFDIGTTYSNISYCIQEPGKVPQVLRVKFPAQEPVNAIDVPSLLYYDSGGNVMAVGFDVLTESVTEAALEKGWTKAEWWKLYLRRRYLVSSIGPHDDLPPLPPGKSAVDVLSDFIKYLFQCAKTHIREYHHGLSWSTVEGSIEYIFTIPNGRKSPGVQQLLYHLAIERAGLVPNTLDGHSRIKILTEGEANVYSCVQMFLKTESADESTPRGVVIIDAGGGHINLTMLSVTSNPISCKGMISAECRRQGSVFVTLRAKALLQRKLNGWAHSVDEDIFDFMSTFDNSTKLVIKSDQEPAYVRVAGHRYSNSEYNISFGKLKLSGKEATDLFSGTIDAIINAFERQLESSTVPITTVFLVGGFSANNWLWSQLQSYFKAGNINVYRPDNHVNKSVSLGAVLCHIDRGNYSAASQVELDTYDEVEWAVQKMKLTNTNFWEKATLEAARCLSGKDNRIAYLQMLVRGSADKALAAAIKLEHPKFEFCRLISDVLEGKDRISEAIACFREMQNELADDASYHGERTQWEFDFQRRCMERSDGLGNAVIWIESSNEVVEYLSGTSSPAPLDRVDILIERSKAWALKKAWGEALSDADQVIDLIPSSYEGYEIKQAALHGAGRYAEAVEAFNTMLSKLETSANKQLRRLYVDARPTIRRIVKDTVRQLPRVLIDTTTGRLHGEESQIRVFEALPICSELISSMTTGLDEPRIQRVVEEFYQYVMFSHKWEDAGEPLFQQVENTSVYDLESSLTNDKLRRFCMLARDSHFRWAWSDTCCIDQRNEKVLHESLIAMFSWYRNSSATIVHLQDVLSSELPGGLRQSIWNTRIWTYQEYVAAKTVLFYTNDWKPYLQLTSSNHKESPQIISEMQQATGVSAQEMAALQPGLDRVREKLYMASTRKTTLVEDAAYALIGIFKAAIPVMYGEGNRAVGRLLEYIVTGSGDATILAWTGTSGDYNSCLPSDLTVYSLLVPPHIPPPIENAEMDRIVQKLRLSLSGSPVTTLYQRLSDLPSPQLAASRLRLPAITCPVTKLIRTSASSVESSVRWHVYRATTSMFGDTEIKTTEDITKMKGLCLVHPWIRPLLDQEHLEDVTALDKTTRALRLVARLRQPFGALLLEQRLRVAYKRVAADNLIVAQIREGISLDDLLEGISTIEIQ